MPSHSFSEMQQGEVTFPLNDLRPGTQQVLALVPPTHLVLTPAGQLLTHMSTFHDLVHFGLKDLLATRSSSVCMLLLSCLQALALSHGRQVLLDPLLQSPTHLRDSPLEYVPAVTLPLEAA